MRSQHFFDGSGKADRAVTERVLEEAAVLHGHRCPSLVYGCRLALILLAELEPGIDPASVVLRHTSSCLRDGAATVLQKRWPALHLVSAKEGGCSLEAAWAGGKVVVEVSPAVRGRVDRIKGECTRVEEFRAAGVAYLLSLPDDEFARVSR